METTRLSTKGQIVLPKALRESRAWTAGTEFTVEERPEGILLRPKRLFKRTTLDDLKKFKWKGKPITLKQMDEAIAESVAEGYDRSRY
jgi:AbrB family looped-hinge helix DNA binding protein